MHVRLKGLNAVHKTLASGQSVTYHYAWKGGPRLPGKPGEAAFIAAYNKAITEKVGPPTNVLQAVLIEYQRSTKFAELSPRTRNDYIRNIGKIEDEFADFPLCALAERGAKAVFLDWRDKLAKQSPRQADYAMSTLAAILAWALDRGKILMNPCTRMGKAYKGTRVESIWSRKQEEAFLQSAPERMTLAFLLASWLGQRQGDLLQLRWSAYDGTYIRLRQSKTGRRVTLPVGEKLKEILDRLKPLDEDRWAETILKNSRGVGWTSDGFRTEWAKAIKKAGIKGVTFHDLRGTAVTRFALAGCSTAEIATFTGHSLEDIDTILDEHYLSRDVELAETAMQRRETYEAKHKSVS
jgi:integrase